MILRIFALVRKYSYDLVDEFVLTKSNAPSRRRAGFLFFHSLNNNIRTYPPGCFIRNAILLILTVPAFDLLETVLLPILS